MDLRPLLRPAPLFLVLLFAAVATVDLVHSLREHPQRPPPLLEPGSFRFEELHPAAGGEAAAALPGRIPLVVDAATGAVSFRTSGILEVPFTVDDRVDALKLRYRFHRAGGSAEVVVGPAGGSGVGRGAEFRRSISSDRKRRGRIRVPLHGRRGSFVLTISVDLNPPAARLDLTSLRLVKESAAAARRRPKARSEQ